MIEELKHFLLVVEHQTFTEAARHAHLSQPALSASIKRLEERVGGALFDRGRHGAALTASGHAFLPHAHSALGAWRDGARAVGEVEGLELGCVRLAAGSTATTYYLPRICAAFRRKYSGVRLYVKEGYALDIREAVARGDIDLGVVTGKGDDDWLCDELILVASPRIDAKKAGFVSFPEGSTTRSLVREHFGDVDVVMELAGMAAVKSNVVAGVGVALLSVKAVERDLRSGRLVRVRDRRTPIRRQLSLVHRGTVRLNPAASALREAILAA